jgi:uncharacterized protein YegL
MPQGGIYRVTSSPLLAERRGFGVLALVSIGILIASMVLALRPAPVSAGVDPNGDPACRLPLDVVFIIDRSGSMASSENIPGSTTRLDLAKQAANNFVDVLDDNGGVGGASGLHQVGLVSFAGASGTSSTDLALGNGTEAQFNTAIGGLSAAGNTPLQAGLDAGSAQLTGANRRDFVDGKAVTHAYVLLSDGRPWLDNATNRPDETERTAYLDGAEQAFSVLMGTSDPDEGGAFILDPVLMDQLSKPFNETPPDGVAGGNFFWVQNDLTSLSGVFEEIVNSLLCGDVTIEKEADPTEVPFGGGEVTYTYWVSHNAPGGLPFSDVAVTDDKCSPVNYDSGDDGDGLLEDGETWVFTCTTTITEETTNTACVSGEYVGSGGETILENSICAEATVTVGDEPPPPDEPSIMIEKDHNELPLDWNGGPVTYTYDVTNTGNVDLDVFDVEDHFLGTTDLACAVPDMPMSGDNGDGILNIGETWHYECTTADTEPGAENEACVYAFIHDETTDQAQDVIVIEFDAQDCDEDEVPEGGEQGSTSTPQQSLTNTATSLTGVSGPLATLVFGLILVLSLGTLAYANVRAARQRR